MAMVGLAAVTRYPAMAMRPIRLPAGFARTEQGTDGWGPTY